MDHNGLISTFVTILLSIGAFHLLPAILDQVFGILKRVLEEFASFLKWFRVWKLELWPRATKPTEPSSHIGSR